MKTGKLLIILLALTTQIAAKDKRRIILMIPDMAEVLKLLKVRGKITPHPPSPAPVTKKPHHPHPPTPVTRKYSHSKFFLVKPDRPYWAKTIRQQLHWLIKLEMRRQKENIKE